MLLFTSSIPLLIFVSDILDYRKYTKPNSVIVKEWQDIINGCDSNNSLESKKFVCTIDPAWVEKIDIELEFVEKAIAEARQFIISNGEVVDISKVRKVSKDSVVHLAKHASLITHFDEETDEFTPDKILMVEKLSDFAIYENRFLYMMLTYTKSFIEYRLKKIIELSRTYDCEMHYKSSTKSNNRTFDIEFSINDHRIDNPYPVKDRDSVKMIEKINNCLVRVDALLGSDLMVQVSKAPMLKPPITKTNVLKMNNNFKRSLALYNYLTEYTDIGYTVEEITYSPYPLSDSKARTIAAGITILKNLEFEYGNNISEDLEENYKKQLEIEKEEEQKKLIEKIARLKKQAIEGGRTMEEYMLALEQRNKTLEIENEQLGLLKKEIESLENKIKELNDVIEELNRKIKQLQILLDEKIKEYEALQQKYIDDIAALKKAHQEEMERTINDYETKISEIKDEYEQHITNITNDLQSQIDQLSEELENKTAQLSAEYEDTFKLECLWY